MQQVISAPDPYILILTGAGLMIALVAWLPLVLKRLPLSLPIVCIGIGVVIFSVPAVTLRPLPLTYPEVTERFTELVVIIALMGAGLKLDRPFSWGKWNITWRLLAVTMPLGILAITAIGGWFLGLSWVAALLLAASLAPTDPVLASDVQVGPPKTGEEDEVRFGLTSEAGLNDGFAFPFVHLIGGNDGRALGGTMANAQCPVGNFRRRSGWLADRPSVWVAHLPRSRRHQIVQDRRRIGGDLRDVRVLWSH